MSSITNMEDLKGVFDKIEATPAMPPEVALETMLQSLGFEFRTDEGRERLYFRGQQLKLIWRGDVLQDLRAFHGEIAAIAVAKLILDAAWDLVTTGKTLLSGDVLTVSQSD